MKPVMRALVERLLGPRGIMTLRCVARGRYLMLSGISAAELAHRLAYSWRR